MTQLRPAGATSVYDDDGLTTIGRRMAVQRLTGRPFAQPAEVVSWLGAVQAQEYAEAKWSVGLRMRSAQDADIEAALDRGEILRTHVLRPTWHFVVAADIRWLLRLTRPRIHRLNAAWYAKSGLDGPTLARAHSLLASILADEQPRTRRELAERLTAEGLDRSGLALGYLLMHAELEEVITSGPRLGGKQHTYTLLDLRSPATPVPHRSPDDALDDLVLRYFRSRGPATATDFSTWSSLAVTDTRRAVARLDGRLTCRHDAGGKAWYSDPNAPPPDAPAASWCRCTTS